jgi:hypothetical protein
MSRYTKRPSRRNTKAVENKGISFRRKLFVYSGRQLLGVFVLNERTGVALAWDHERHFIGRFAGFKAAASAIGRTHQTRASKAEARRKLLEPARFASGLPAAWEHRR